MSEACHSFEVITIDDRLLALLVVPNSYVHARRNLRNKMYCFMTSIYVTDICDDTFSYKQVIISEVFVIMDCVKPSVTLYA